MKKPLIAVVAIAIIILILVFGFYLGRERGKDEGRKQLDPIIDAIYPKPAAEIKNLSGRINAVYGATIELEITDPDDYLPHADGTSQRKEIRYATVSADTKIILSDMSKSDKQGNPKQTIIKISDLKTNDQITVRSDKNIRDAEKFDVTEIEVIKLP